MRRLILSLTLSLCGLMVSAQGIVFQDNAPWDSIVAQAQQENKLIFIDCYTTWCGPCKALAKEIFPQQQVGDYFNPNFICVKYDMEKGDGKMLNEKYKSHIIGYPTLLFIDKNQKVKQQLAGYQEADVLLTAAKQVQQGRDLFTLQKEYKEGRRDIGFLNDYIGSLNAAFMKEEAQQVAKEYLDTHEPETLDNDTVWSAVGQYVTDIHSPHFEYLVGHAARYGGVLKRNREEINFQIKVSCERELRDKLRITFDSTGVAAPLPTDTLWMEKVVGFMEKVGLPNADINRYYIYIHKQLLNGNNDEAWQTVKRGVWARLSGFYSMRVEEYVGYLLPLTKDKKVLKDYASVIESFQRGRKGMGSYTAYKTLSDINRKLGNKQLAEEQMQTYITERDKEIKKFQEMFNLTD